METGTEAVGELIGARLAEYLRLVEPDAAGHLRLDRIMLLDPPGRTTAAEDGVEVIAEVPLRGEDERLTVLVRIEPEALPEPEAGRRLGRSLAALGLGHNRPVLLSIISLRGGRPGIHLGSGALWEACGIELARMYYTTFNLERTRAEHYLERPEPLAWGLAAFLSPTRRSLEEHRRACLERIAGRLLPGGGSIRRSSRSRRGAAEIGSDRRDHQLDDPQRAQPARRPQRQPQAPHLDGDHREPVGWRARGPDRQRGFDPLEGPDRSLPWFGS